ncbi:MAG: GumC family protein [Drouetiella hepatica Uher 2000/2452]|uniref:GumC family protein n=1 Tax=Drouetiella hepatica Uher 2000/2452 TaxID=904376 RepID=A0A951UPE2_9CYAN|nr:GumC family protein [Drouetiella hepatica Uher 2000/2452]
MESRDALDVDFSRYREALCRSWIPALAAFVTTVLLSAWYTTRLKPLYQADAKLLFKADRASALTALTKNPQDGEALKSLLQEQSPLNSEIEILSSRPLLQQTIAKLNLKANNGKPLDVQGLEARLNIKIVGAADVIQMIYQGEDPQEATAVINTLVDLYIRSSTLAGQSETVSAREFLASQTPQSEANVRSAESALRDFKEQNQVVALDKEAESAVAILGNLDSQILSTRAEMEETSARTLSLRDQIALDPRSAIVVSALSQSPAIQSILTDLQQIQRQLAAERSRFSDASPIVLRLNEREALLRSLLQQEVAKVAGSPTSVPEGLLQIGELKQSLITAFLTADVQRLSLARKLDSLQNSKAQYQQRVYSLPELEQEQRELERRLTAAQNTYEALLARQEELQVKERQVAKNVRVIEPAIVPTQPLASKKIMVLGLGTVAGALLGLTIALISEFRSTYGKKKLPSDRKFSPEIEKHEEKLEIPTATKLEP